MRFQELDQRIKALLVGGNTLDFLARFLHRGADTFLVKRLKDVVDRIDFKGFYRILIKGSSEYDLRKRDLLIN